MVVILLATWAGGAGAGGGSNLWNAFAVVATITIMYK